MSDHSAFALGLVASYLLGAVPASYLAARARGIDLRRRGSRNLGATNVLRTLGWTYAVPVGLFDVGKGAVPAWLFPGWFGGPSWAGIAFGGLAVVGHVFSVFVAFRGGKGIATAAGAFLALSPLAVLAAGAVWGVTVYATGYVSLGSVLAAVCFPVAVGVLTPEAPAVLWGAAALAMLLVFKHRANIQRLLAGTESRFGQHGAGR